jgi:hypothetical protein
MQKPPEIRRLAWTRWGRTCLDQHGGDDEHLGSKGNKARGRHFYDTHFISFTLGESRAPKAHMGKGAGILNCKGRE